MLIGNYGGGVAFYEGDINVSQNINTTKLDPINIYPNPTSKNVQINLGTNDINNAKIIVVDLLGKVIFTQKPTYHKVNIDLSNYANGVYFIQFSNAISSNTFKVIKE